MNYQKPSMAKCETVYCSGTLSATLITSEYTSAYTEHSFNIFPAISLPVTSGFHYQAAGTKILLDTSQVLFEQAQTEFVVSKHAVFSSDATLCIQFMEAESDYYLSLFDKQQQVMTKKRTVETDILLRTILSARGAATVAKEQLLNNILSQLAYEGPQRTATKEPGLNQLKQIERAKEFIHACYHQNLGIADIASAACLSQFYFSRMFRRVTGYSPYDYLLLTRIGNAKKLLEKEVTVTQTAFDCGFNSLEHFSYTFSRITGCSPAAYRKSRISKA